MAHIRLDWPLKSQKLLAVPQNDKVQFFLCILVVHKQIKVWKFLFFWIHNENHKSTESYLESSDVMVSNPHQKILILWLSVVYILKWIDTMLSVLFCLFFKLWSLKFKICMVMLSLKTQTRHTFLDSADVCSITDKKKHVMFQLEII